MFALDGMQQNRYALSPEPYSRIRKAVLFPSWAAESKLECRDTGVLDLWVGPLVVLALSRDVFRKLLNLSLYLGSLTWPSCWAVIAVARFRTSRDFVQANERGAVVATS